MSKEFNVYLEFGRKRLKQLKNYKRVAREIKKLAQKHLGNVDVYVFGSVIEGKPTASSDIDILIVKDKIGPEEACRFKTLIHELMDAPMELHIVSSCEFENWYKRFIDKLEKVA
ncbi:MAG: nucleotidyltransferase domain-containing protein [Candidatus Bathyarchaeia archaeon]